MIKLNYQGNVLTLPSPQSKPEWRINLNFKLNRTLNNTRYTYLGSKVWRRTTLDILLFVKGNTYRESFLSWIREAQNHSFTYTDPNGQTWNARIENSLDRLERDANYADSLDLDILVTI